VALAVWVTLAIVGAIWTALKSVSDDISKNLNASRKRREEKKKQAAIEKEKDR
jgi:hypothetical protein